MNFTVITEASVAIKIHLATAVLALVLGLVIWRMKKGTARHKLYGRIFVGLMLVTAFSTFFIRQINQGQLSLIHIFIPITIIGSAQAVYYARNRNFKRHKKAVQGLFFGALIIPGLLTFLPGRTLFQFFFG